MNKFIISLLLFSFMGPQVFAESKPKAKEKSSWDKITESPLKYGEEVIDNTKKAIEKSADALDKKVKISHKKKETKEEDVLEKKTSKKKTKSPLKR